MEILWLLVVGIVIGLLARLLMPGRDPIGIIGTLVIGIVGALVGGYLWRQIFSNTEGTEWIGGIIVAMILLGIYRSMTYRRGGITR